MRYPVPNLRLHRQRQGLSLDTLGQATGIERTLLSRAERGFGPGLLDEKIERLAAYLHVRPATLTGQGFNKTKG